MKARCTRKPDRARPWASIALRNDAMSKMGFEACAQKIATATRCMSIQLDVDMRCMSMQLNVDMRTSLMQLQHEPLDNALWQCCRLWVHSIMS